MSEAKITLSAEDKTRAAIASAKAGLAGLQRSAETLNASFGSFGKVFGAAFAGLSFTAFVRSTAEGLDKLNDLKDATGASVENISALEDVASRTGGSIDDVSTSLVKFNAALNASDKDSKNASIFKQLGLDAEALKNQDPAEALRQTAVALAGFADDGNKARIVQELFGKSIKEVGPFLADLATQAKLVGKVTKEEAEEATKFSDSLKTLEKNSLDLARALSGPVIKGINDTAAAFKSGREQGDSFLQFLTDRYNQSNGVAPRSAIDRTKELGDEIARIDGILASGTGLEQRRNALLEKRLGLQTQLNAVKIAEAVKLAEGIGPDPALRPKSVGALPDKPDKPKRAAGERAGIEGPLRDRQEAFRAGELALQQLTDEALRTGQVAEAEAIRADALKNTALQYQLVQERYDRLNDLIGATPTAKLEEAQFDMLLLADAFERGAISAEQFNEAATSRLGLVGPEIKEQVDELQVFAEQAGRNIQDALGNTVEATLKGNFENIGKLWGDLLVRMASEAAAAQIGKELFGNFGTTGQIGGSVGDLGKLLGNSNVLGDLLNLFPSFDVGTPYVPHDMFAKIHKGERIVPAAENRASQQAAPVTISNVFHVGSDVSPQTVRLLEGMINRNNAMIRRSAATGGGWSAA